MAYVLISVLNGYKNIVGVFKTRATAEQKMNVLKADTFHYGEHEFYIADYIMW